jgi:hypothetical protein
MHGLDPSVQAAIVTGGVTLLVALVSIAGEMVRRQGKVLHHVKEQVANSHTTNLRDDLDRVIGGLERVLENQDMHDGLLKAHGYELGYLRKDMQQERRERQVVEERLDSHLADAVQLTAVLNKLAARAGVES